MYAWIFRRVLIGPTWLKVLEAIAITLGIIYLCFEYVYPFIQDYFHLVEVTV